MSSNDKGRGIRGRDRDNDALPVPPGRDRDRGRRGQTPTQGEAVGRSGLLGQRQVGDVSARGNRTLFARGGSSSATRQGTEIPTPGGSRAAAAAYEASRRQHAAEERARIQASRQNPQTQRTGVEASSSRGRVGRTPAEAGSQARDTSQSKHAGRTVPLSANNDDDDDYDDNYNDNDNDRRSIKGTSLPIDLPTTYYEALRLADAPSTYINYPSRIHHLKHPTQEFTPFLGHKWEDIHLHQKLSSPRLQTRWTRPSHPGEPKLSREFFMRFHAGAGYEPFMGFRPYKDIFFLDGQYMAAMLEHSREAERLVVVPFLTSADRSKIRILAVAASAFHRPLTRARVCAALLSAFPGVVHVFLVSVAPVPRPVSAAWDLDTEFARWIKVPNHATRSVKAQRTKDLVASVGAYGGEGQQRDELNENEDVVGGKDSLVEQVEGAFVLVRESGLRTAENRAQAEEALERKRETPDWDNIDLEKILEPRTSTSDVSSGSTRSSGVARKIKVEACVMLYFKDAYDRAVSKGWSAEADLTSVDHLNLEME